MTNIDSQYEEIIDLCNKSQSILNGYIKEFGEREALIKREPFVSMWSEYSKGITTLVKLRNCNFSGLLFNRAKFNKHNFIDCDFSKSRWVFSSLENCNCSGSNFSSILTVLSPFKNTNCANCDFTNTELTLFAPFVKNNFENANFTNAKIDTSHSFFNEKKGAPKANFKNAIMNGCRLTIAREKQYKYNKTEKELKPLLQEIFSENQLAVMHIDYVGKSTEPETSSGCFIATAACGTNSREVIILRYFRDTVLLNNALGRLFIKIYYRISPSIAFMIERSPKARHIIRNVLIHPLVKLLYRIKLKNKSCIT